jgi:hypothetical protein
LDNPAWNGLVAAIKVCHTLRLREAGTVPGPQLFALRNGLVRARIRLRPDRHGSDAVAAIAAMAALAVAAQADEVVASWETLDLAAACGLRLLHNNPALNLLCATRDRGVLSRFPYREQVRLAEPPMGGYGSNRGGRPQPTT